MDLSRNSAKVAGKSREKAQSWEKSVFLFSQANLIVEAQQNNLPGDVHEEFGLINVHLFNIVPGISSGKVGIFMSGEWYGYTKDGV